MYQAWQTVPGGVPHAWSDKIVQGPFAGPITAIQNKDKRLELFVLRANGEMYQAWQNSPGGQWIN